MSTRGLFLLVLSLVACACDDGGDDGEIRYSFDGYRDPDAGPGSDAGAPDACRRARTEASASLARARDYCDACSGGEADGLCCTVQGSCCVDDFTELAAIDFTACGQDGDCELQAEAFGPEPRFGADGLLPAAHERQRSGFVVAAPLERSARFRLRARFRVPDAEACDGCVELVGMGLSERRGDALAGDPAPPLSLVASSALARVLLSQGGNVIWSAEVDDRAHDYELVRQPDGRARLLIDDELAAELTLPLPARALRPFVFSRADVELDTEAHASIAALSVAAARCEQTAEWSQRRALSRADGQDLVAPSVLELDGERHVAYEAAGAIFVATEDAAGRVSHDAARPLLSASGRGFAAAAVGDPEWAPRADGLWLYYTARDAYGRRSIGRAAVTTNGGDFELTRWHQVLDPEALGLREAFGPSASHDLDGTPLLLVTGVDSGGATRLLLLRRGPTGYAASSLADATVAWPGAEPDRLDFLALGSADLVLRRGLHHLYYCGLSGRGWSIGLRVSDDLEDWLPAGVVLDGGDPGDFDGAGVRDPDVVSAGDELAIYYTALAAGDETDPPARSLGRASRSVDAVCGGVDCGPLADCSPGAPSTCLCQPGNVRDDDAQCVPEVDECATGVAGCAAEATCTDTPLSYRCQCMTGYRGDGASCEDIDECAEGSAACDPAASCDNTPGAYSCSCPPELRGDGMLCRSAESLRATFGDDSDSQRVAVGPDGSIYLAGSFTALINFGDDDGDALTPAGGSTAGGGAHYLVRLDRGGQHVWSLALPMNLLLHDLAVDAEGNVAVVGTYPTADPPDLGDGRLPTFDSSNAFFVASHDAGGALRWSAGFGSSGDTNTVYGAAFDGAGALLLSGRSAGVVAFGPLSVGTRDLDHSVSFVVRLDREGQADASAELGTPRAAGGLALDDAGQVYVAGQVRGDYSFGQSVTTPHGANDGYVAMLTAALEPVRLWRFGGEDPMSSTDVTGLAVERETGSVAVIGSLQAGLVLDDTRLLPAADGAAYYALKLGGDSVAWTRGLSDEEYPSAIAADGRGGNYLAQRIGAGETSQTAPVLRGLDADGAQTFLHAPELEVTEVWTEVAIDPTHRAIITGYRLTERPVTFVGREVLLLRVDPPSP